MKNEKETNIYTKRMTTIIYIYDNCWHYGTGYGTGHIK